MVRTNNKSIEAFLGSVRHAADKEQAPYPAAPTPCGTAFDSYRDRNNAWATNSPSRNRSCELHLSNSAVRPRNINLVSIDDAFRPGLRIRLTPRGRTCLGKPWNFGDRDSHPVFRYSCPHNHFLPLHGNSRLRFDAGRNAPLPSLDPQFRHTAYSRSFSAQNLSTSQLLRTV